MFYGILWHWAVTSPWCLVWLVLSGSVKNQPGVCVYVKLLSERLGKLGWSILMVIGHLRALFIKSRKRDLGQIWTAENHFGIRIKSNLVRLHSSTSTDLVNIFDRLVMFGSPRSLNLLVMIHFCYCKLLSAFTAMEQSAVVLS